MPYDYGQYFGEITLTHDLTTLPVERTWRLAPPGRDVAAHEIVLYLGCNVLRTSHMIRTITAIFDSLGLDYVAVGGPTYCCGTLHHQHRDQAPPDGMRPRTPEPFGRFRPKETVMGSPSRLSLYYE